MDPKSLFSWCTSVGEEMARQDWFWHREPVHDDVRSAARTLMQRRHHVVASDDVVDVVVAAYESEKRERAHGG